jgi:hypothetical protein
VVHVARIGYKGNTFQVLGDKNKEEKHLKDPTVDGRLILQQRLLTGFTWFVNWTNCERV